MKKAEEAPGRVRVYLRVSTDTQDVATQEQGVRDFCAARQWEIHDWTRDEGVSGAKEPSKRRLGRLLKSCRPGDILVFSEISRIGRKLDMILDFIRECSERGIKIYTVKDRYVLEDTIQSKVLVTVMGLAAEIERDLLKQRTREGLRRAVASGRLLGRPPGRRHTAPARARILPDGLKDKVLESLATHGMKAVARRYHVNRNTLYKRLADWGVQNPDAEFKSRGKTGPCTCDRMTAEKLELARARFRAGETVAEVAAAIGYSQGGLSAWMERNHDLDEARFCEETRRARIARQDRRLNGNAANG